jgi:hypothetical protein
MNESTLKGLVDKLERRAARIKEAEDIQFRFSLQQLGAFLKSDALLQGILADLANRHPECRTQALAKRVFVPSGTYFPNGFAQGQTDSTNAAMQYAVFTFLFDHCDSSDEQVSATLAVSREIIKSVVIQPLLDHLIEQLDSKNIVVGELVRYKTRCECFSRERLFEEAK